MSVEHQRRFRFQLKHASVNNWNYTEYIPVVPRHFTTTMYKPTMSNAASGQCIHIVHNSQYGTRILYYSH